MNNIEILESHGLHLKDSFGFFYGGVLSNFYKTSFIVDDICFSSSEQYFMYKKAMCFGDVDIAQKILKTNDPVSAKKLGRMVKNFDEDVWDKVRYDHMYTGCYAKFSQNADLKKIIKKTKNIKLVEASPYDKIWGIGMNINNKDITNPEKWKGQNLLGKILTKIRKRL